MILNVGLKKAFEKYKDCPAITDKDGERTLTYGELDILSGRVAAKLLSLGIGYDDTVAVIMGRHMEYVAAELGILKMGAVVIPLIPSYPEKRVEYIKKDANVKLCIKEDFFNDIDSFEPVETKDSTEDSRVFMIYTSGSTGNPKGVIYRSKAVYAHIERNCKGLADKKPLVYAAPATMSFTVTIDEYYRNFFIGAHVHILSDSIRGDIAKISQYYADNKVTYGFIPPRMIKMYENKTDTLFMVSTGSERVVNVYSPDFKIVNKYGQTETVGCICTFTIDKPYENTPVGKPTEGISIKIVDENGLEVEKGEEGFVVATGILPYEYNNLPEQTAKTFKKNDDGTVSVNTGDLGKIDEGGNLVFVNRNDWMIKIHGQRVEPGEIEATMNLLDGVKASVVKAFEQEDGSMLLCGFYTGTASDEEVKEAVSAKLPKYMIPQVFVQMEAFPVNANGKVDRMAIEKPDMNLFLKDYEAPQGEIEAAICHGMEKVLGYSRVGRKDNFLEIGGNSVNVAKLVAECNIPGLSPQFVMIGKTPEGISSIVEENKGVVKAGIEKAPEDIKEVPLTPAQSYQIDVCTTWDVTSDLIDFIGYWKLWDEMDEDKLIKAVDDTLKAHKVYSMSCTKKDGGSMIFGIHNDGVRKNDIAKADFEDWRRQKTFRERDLSKDTLYDIELLHVENERYLYVNFNHLIYDGVSLKLFMEEVDNRYHGKDVKEEEYTIFDLAYSAEKISRTQFYDNALQYFEGIYSKIENKKVLQNSEITNTFFDGAVLKDVKQEEIDSFVAKNGISDATFFTGAFSLAISAATGLEGCPFMTIFDGRSDMKLKGIHGVLANAVYLSVAADENSSMAEYLTKCQEVYQKMVYFDAVNIPTLKEKFPQIDTGITFNYQGKLADDTTFGDRTFRFEYGFEPMLRQWPMPWPINMRFQQIEGEYHAVITSRTMTRNWCQKFIEMFDLCLREILKGKTIKEIKGELQA